MKKTRPFRVGVWTLPTVLILAGAAFAGVFARESAETIGKLVQDGKGNVDVVAGSVTGRSFQKNVELGFEDSYVTVLEISGRSLITLAPVTVRVSYLGASWNPALQYGTTAEPRPSTTAPGKQIVAVIDKGGANASWSLVGMNRIAPVVRNASGQEVAVSESAGFFVDRNMSMSELESRIRKAAGLK